MIRIRSQRKEAEKDLLAGIACTKLDFAQPLALMLMGILGHIAITTDEDEQARSTVRHLTAALPSGSYRGIYDGTNTDPFYVEAIRLYDEGGDADLRPERRSEIARLGR